LRCFFFSSRRRHTRFARDWSSDVCSSDLQHLNAYTSFDETVYFLPIPSDDPVKLDKGFQILEDWAFNANLDANDIDDERGVVIEEYRTRLGRSEEHTSELQSRENLVCRLLLEKKKTQSKWTTRIHAHT